MITFSHYSKDVKENTISSVSYTVYEDANLSDLMQEFRRFLLACSYTPESVDKYIEAE